MDGDTTFNGKKSSPHRCAMNLATKDPSVGPLNLEKEGCISRRSLRNGTTLSRRDDAFGLQMQPSKNAAPELRQLVW